MPSPVPDRATARVRARYNRFAPLYEWGEAALLERGFSPQRALLWSGVPAGRVLEVGVGVGANLPYYPPGARVTAVDLSPAMLARAARRARRLGLNVDLRLMDAQALDFPDASFDAVVSSFVFCAVPDPVRGLRELGRVCRPGGSIHLLEHVRSRRPWLGRLMDLLNPLTVRLIADHINRDAVANARLAGLEVEEARAFGLIRLIRAKPRKDASNG